MCLSILSQILSEEFLARKNGASYADKSLVLPRMKYANVSVRMG